MMRAVSSHTSRVFLWGRIEKIATSIVPLHTSEKAGAVTVLYLFHSSPSEATMFLPKTDSIEYRSAGLGNLAREVVTSCKTHTKDQIHLV